MFHETSLAKYSVKFNDFAELDCPLAVFGAVRQILHNTVLYMKRSGGENS